MYSCQTGKNDSSVESDHTTEVYIAGDTISSQKEEFDVEEFIQKQQEAKDLAKLEAAQKLVEESANEEKESQIVKTKKKSSAKPKKYYPEIEYLEDTYDVGDIIEGDVITHSFTFKNVGKLPLNIEKAVGTCGCTQPSFPFLSIEPGDVGTIGVSYHSVGKSGPQKPEIIGHSDAKNDPVKTLFLNINVKDKPKESPTDTLDQKEY